ncbi:MAG: sensor domain-containing diguanylate cyclase [Oceanococcus sp.]
MTGNSPSTADRLRDEAIEDLGLQDLVDDSTFHRVVQIASTALLSENVAFSVLYKQQQVYLASRGVPLKSLPREQALCSETTQHARALLLSDARESEFRAHPGVATEAGVRFYAGIPVRAPCGETIGSFCLYGFEPRKLSLPEQRMLGECAGLIEDSLYLRGLAARDALTGLLNRREFDIRYKAEYERALRDRTDISLAIVDIDHFKMLNDKLGHQTGDAALIQVARTLEKYVRGDRDSAFRIGGEEFALILPGMPAEQAHNRLDLIRQALIEQRISNPTAPAEILSFSAGISSNAPGRESVSARALYRLADDALYQAKANGRNQVMIANHAH